jgi:uncharacterized protein (TIGR02246 family)
MFPFRGLTVFVVASGILACTEGSHARRYRETADARGEIHALLDTIARAISSRDAREIARRMPTDSSVVYVSDGRPIRGTELQAALETFYATQRTIHFRWDSMRLAPLSDDVWTATAWAQIGLTDTTGTVTNAPAIFTWTVVRRGGRWQLAMAHKTTLSHQ